MFLLFVTTALAGSSGLWGTAGEAWDPLGRLPDFSYAGYHAGEVPLPDNTVAASVADFGAVGDGVTDDTAAIQAAITATTGVLGFPAGTYRLTDVLTIDHSDVVLRGESGAVLKFEVSLADVRGPAEQWSWDGGLVWVQGPNIGGEVASVAVAASRGDTALTVADASGIAVGDRVLLVLTDDGTRSLTSHLHNDQDLGGNCDYQVPDSHRWPVRITSIDGNVLGLEQPLRHDVRLAWTPRLRAAPTVEEVGVEHLRIEFPDVPYAGHLLEPGYNGVYMARGVVDSWVRDVTFVNADSGILLAQWTQHVTAEGIVFEGREGHHGFNIAHSADALVQDVTFHTTFRHELSVDHKANGCVFKRVHADGPVDLDHHRDAPFENLFTDFEAVTTWVHGGNWCAGPPSAARGTFWNLPGPIRGPYWGHIQTNVIGDVDDDPLLTEDAEWFEPVDDLWPPDLHDAQLRRRLGLEPLDPPDTDTDDDTDIGIDLPVVEPDRGCVTGGVGVGPWALVALFALVRRREEGATLASSRR